MVLNHRTSHVVPFLEQPNLSIAHCFVVLVEHPSGNRAHRTHAKDDAGGNLVWTNDDRRAEALVLIQGLKKKSGRLRAEVVLSGRNVMKDKGAVRSNFRSPRLIHLPGGNQLHESVVDNFSRSRIYEGSAHLKPPGRGTRSLLRLNADGKTSQ